MATSDKNPFLRMLQDLPTWGPCRMALITGTPQEGALMTIPTDIYLAPIDNPPVEVGALTDASGHLLRLPDDYRWAGTLRRDSDGMRQWERGWDEEWLSVYPAHPFGEITSGRSFQLLAVTHEFLPDQLVWVVRWLPRTRVVTDGGGIADLIGQHDTALGFTMRTFYVGPGMRSASVRAKLGLSQEHS